MPALPEYFWMEPGRHDQEEGLRARVADPVWFLTRQWQLGELQGEDASSPVVVTAAPRHIPLTYSPSRPALDPTVIPAESLRGGRTRRLVDDRPTRPTRDRRRRRNSIPPTAMRTYSAHCPRPTRSWQAGSTGARCSCPACWPDDPIWAEIPSPITDRWSTWELTYNAPFDAGNTALSVRNHDGGDVDWFTVDADPARVPIGGAPADPPTPRQVIPGRLDYPGAPNPRWWQIEDHAVDIGGFAPDRSHLATMLLLDVVLAHPDDWFSFPVPPPQDSDQHPSSGVLVSLDGVIVRDSFDTPWPLDPPPASGPDAWSLFHTAGLPESQLLIWPVTVGPHIGPELDDVVIGVDEDANLAWAVELRADGLELLHDISTTDAIAETTRTGTREFEYLPSTTLPNHWHPYQRVRDGDPPGVDPPPAGVVLGLGDGRSGIWRQAVLADLTGPQPVPRPGPISRLIGGPSGTGLGRGHELAATAIPSSGVRLRRRAMLARDTAGRPVLWVQRSASPVTGPPTSHLRFDVFAEKPTSVGEPP